MTNALTNSFLSSAVYTDEQARDALGAAFIATAPLTVVVNDAANTITFATSLTQYTDEMAMDAIAAALVGTPNLSVVYNDVANTITLTVINQKRIISPSFASALTSLETLPPFVATETLTIADDFAGAYCRVEFNPTSSFVITVYKNVASVGTITISTSGVATFVTTGTTIPLVAGDVLKFVGPSSVDATIANVAIGIPATIG